MSARHKWGWSMATGLLTLLVVTSLIAPAGATILNFDIKNSSDNYVNNSAIANWSDYGKNVSATDISTYQTGASGNHYYYGLGDGATPNVAASWSASTTTVYTYNGGNWLKAFYIYANDKSVYLTLTPDAGYAVDVTSFQSMGYGGSNGTGTYVWTLHADSTTGASLATDTVVCTDGATRTAAINTTGAYGQTVVLEIHENSGADYSNLGFDNISFSQVAAPPPPTPEPGTLVLLVTGLLGLLCYAWRQRK
jgi:hypothetical protein